MGLMDMVQKVTGSAKVACKKCSFETTEYELIKNFYLCPNCGFSYRLGARDRISLMADKRSFSELFTGLTSINFLEFPSYQEKLDKAHASTPEEDAVV